MSKKFRFLCFFLLSLCLSPTCSAFLLNQWHEWVELGGSKRHRRIIKFCHRRVLLKHNVELVPVKRSWGKTFLLFVPGVDVLVGGKAASLTKCRRTLRDLVTSSVWLQSREFDVTADTSTIFHIYLKLGWVKLELFWWSEDLIECEFVQWNSVHWKEACDCWKLTTYTFFCNMPKFYATQNLNWICFEQSIYNVKHSLYFIMFLVHGIENSLYSYIVLYALAHTASVVNYLDYKW